MLIYVNIVVRFTINRDWCIHLPLGKDLIYCCIILGTPMSPEWLSSSIRVFLACSPTRDWVTRRSPGVGKTSPCKQSFHQRPHCNSHFRRWVKLHLLSLCHSGAAWPIPSLTKAESWCRWWSGHIAIGSLPEATAKKDPLAAGMPKRILRWRLLVPSTASNVAGRGAETPRWAHRNSAWPSDPCPHHRVFPKEPETVHPAAWWDAHHADHLWYFPRVWYLSLWAAAPSEVVAAVPPGDFPVELGDAPQAVEAYRRAAGGEAGQWGNGPRVAWSLDWWPRKWQPDCWLRCFERNCDSIRNRHHRWWSRVGNPPYIPPAKSEKSLPIQPPPPWWDNLERIWPKAHHIVPPPTVATSSCWVEQRRNMAGIALKALVVW